MKKALFCRKPRFWKNRKSVHDGTEYAGITQEGEASGLYENSRIIGFKKSWEHIIKQNSYELIDGLLSRATEVSPCLVSFMVSYILESIVVYSSV